MLIRQRALNIAQTQVGVKEVGFSNWGPRVGQYLKSANVPFPAAWCMAFVHWCFEKAGKDLNHINQASVGFFYAWGAKMGYQVTRPMKGDVVCFNFDANLWPDHVGFVARAVPGFVYTVEGNTQPGVGGNQAEGGGVYRRVRSTNRCLFIRVPGTTRYQYEEKREARKMYLRSWILRKKHKEGWSWKKIKAHPYAQEYYNVLGGK